MNSIEIVLGIVLILIIVVRPRSLKRVVISDIGKIVFSLVILYLLLNHSKYLASVGCIIFIVMFRVSICFQFFYNT